jgi:hypothetical protein
VFRLPGLLGQGRKKCQLWKTLMKRIKHNDLTHYFLRPHQELPRSYIDSCEKFFRELKNLKLARLTAENVQKKKEQ